MKYRRHTHLGSRSDDRIRERLGGVPDPLYVIDDGGKHRMICREVGVDEEGVKYYLNGRITLRSYDRFTGNDVSIYDLFSEADDLSLCSVYEAPESASNVLLVESYTGINEVPPEYLPPNPLIQFSSAPARGDRVEY